MAAGAAGTRNIRAQGAVPGSMPPPSSAASSRQAAAPSPINPDMPVEKLITRARQAELVAMAESGNAAEAIRAAVREALQGVTSGEPVLAKGDVATPADIARQNKQAAIKSEAIAAAMSKHFRGELEDSPVSMGPAWTEAKMSMQFLRVLTPFMSAVIHNPGSGATVEEKRDKLIFMQNATAQLAKVMVDVVTQQPDINVYEQRELNVRLSTVIGHIWENTPEGDDPQERMTELLKLVRAVYADRDFAQRHNKLAAALLDHDFYLKVDSPETMTSRLSMAMHLAGMKFAEATGDSRVMTSTGVAYSYNKDRSEVVGMMLKTFDSMVAKLTMQHQFVESLSNDMRTTTLMAWMRVASNFMADEYIQQTSRSKNWMMQVKNEPKEFAQRFREANARLPDVIERAGEVALASVRDMISQSIGETARVRGEQYYTDVQLAAEKARAEAAAPAETQDDEVTDAPR